MSEILEIVVPDGYKTEEPVTKTKNGIIKEVKIKFKKHEIHYSRRG